MEAGMLRFAYSTDSWIGWLPEPFLFFCILFVSQVGSSLQVPAPAIIGHDVDLQVFRIEVTQAIQAYDNSVPLSVGKSTYVRAFVSEGRFVDSTIPGVLGEMYVLWFIKTLRSRARGWLHCCKRAEGSIGALDRAVGAGVIELISRMGNTRTTAKYKHLFGGEPLIYAATA